MIGDFIAQGAQHAKGREVVVEGPFKIAIVKQGDGMVMELLYGGVLGFRSAAPLLFGVSRCGDGAG